MHCAFTKYRGYDEHVAGYVQKGGLSTTKKMFPFGFFVTICQSCVMLMFVPRVGIIGEPMSQYNPQTLTPLGAEQDEENEADSRRK